MITNLHRFAGTVFAFLSLLLALYMDWLFLQSTLNRNFPTQDVEWFLFGFFNIVLILMITIPLLIEKRLLLNSSITTFLDLPDQESPITYSTITLFLGEQALGSFLITAVILTSRNIISNFGPFLGGIFAAPAILFCILVVAISLTRLIVSLTHYPRYIYIILSVIALTVSFQLFGIGIKLAN